MGLIANEKNIQIRTNEGSNNFKFDKFDSFKNLIPGLEMINKRKEVIEENKK